MSAGGKHRETQLQLQRKLQEREHIREQKRKLQVGLGFISLYSTSIFSNITTLSDPSTKYAKD